MNIALTKPRLKRLAFSLLTIYLVVLGVLFLAQRSLLYRPFGDYTPPAERGMERVQELRLPTVDGQKALAWFLPPPEDGNGRIIVFFHGNAGSVGYASSLLSLIERAGFGYIAPEYRGYPGYPGSTTEEGIYMDARAAMDFVQQRGFAPKDVVLLGRSLGSGVAVQMATEYEVGLVALVSPFTGIADAAQEIYWYVPVNWLLLDRFDSFGKLDRVRAPVYIFHGDKDRLVPFALGKRLYDAIDKPKRLFTLEGQSHNRLDFPFIVRQLADYSDAQWLTTIPESGE